MSQGSVSALSPAEMAARIVALEAQLASLETCPTCGGLPRINPNFCEECRRAERQRPRPTPRIEAKPTPQCTIEAILYCVRERGASALKEPANVARLRTCDPPARTQINHRMARLLQERGNGP
jgi:hypothetical protein